MGIVSKFVAMFLRVILLSCLKMAVPEEGPISTNLKKTKEGHYLNAFANFLILESR